MTEHDARARPRVGYLGPAGTFSEQALRASLGADTVQRTPLPSIYDAVMALRDGEVRWAIAPIENSLEGSLSVTLDLLADETSEVEIVGETRLRVRHSLIAREALELREIDVVVSHPQVPGQCLRFLRGELAHARILPASSTAEAVRLVAGAGPRGRAALGTALAAEIYGATVIREGVQDREDNETRFVWLARSRAGVQAQAPPGLHPEGTGSKTSLAFWGAGAEHSGWLARCLDEFARRQINLTKIESRPRRERLGHYVFFVDLEGGLQQPAVAAAVQGLRAVCEQVRVLGSYPSGA
jgi:prephenate dehydratase